MDDSTRAQRYREVLPLAYVAASLKRDGKATGFDVGMCAREIMACEEEASAAYRIAMASQIHCTIVSVTRETTPFGAEKFRIAYRSLKKDAEQEEIPTPLLSDYRLGAMTRKIWDRFDERGNNYWVGKRMTLFKHNDPPTENSKSPQGYRCCVYAKEL